MQVLNLDADLNISRLDADIRTLRLGEGGTTNYNDLTNKPSINSVTLTGNKTTSDLNIKTSDLINDEGFITNADIPTKTSDLTNDSGFITSAQAPVQSVNGYTGAVSLDGSNLDYDAALSINDKIEAVETAIPTKTSDLTNDSGFITAAGVPSKTSDLINDSGFITSADIPTDVSAFTNDAGYQTAANVNTLIQAAMPTTETIENESIASFSDGADNVPVSELIVNITATQAGSGTPSPSNPRAISGHSSCTITVEDDIDTPQEVKTVTISLGDTYYGGTLNVTTGELTITHAILEKTVASMNNADEYPGWKESGARAIVGDGINQRFENQILNVGSTVGINTTTPQDIIFMPTIAYGLTQSEWMENYPDLTIQFVLEYAQPTTVQLTPTEVRTLLEDNNIFADTGDINELVYFKTGCEAIARLIEAYT